MQFNTDQLGPAQYIVFAVVAVAVYFLLSLAVRARGNRFHSARRYWYDGGTDHRSVIDFPESNAFDNSVRQLGAVMQADFERARILNYGEYRVFRVVESHFATSPGNHRVFAQTSLGQVLKSNDDAAFRSINSKRVDILVVDGGGWPVLAVEYQGQGHYQGTAAARDAVKKEALRRAGVRYLEIYADDTDQQIETRLRDAMQRSVAFGQRNAGVATPSASADASEKEAAPVSPTDIVPV